MKTIQSPQYGMTTDANVQAFVTMFHTNMVAFGWVQTSDTGQVNPATAVNPGTGNNSTTGSIGYIVYHSNDGLTTYYLRVQFFRTDNTSPWFKLTMGWATDGAGNITGNSQSLSSIQSNRSYTGAQQVLMAGGAGWVTFNGCASVNDVSSAHLFSVERDRDSSGAEVNTGIVGIVYTTTNRNLAYIPSSGTVPAIEGDWPIAFFEVGSIRGVTQSNWVSTHINGYQHACFPVPMKEAGGGYAVLGMGVVGTNDAVYFDLATKFTRYGTDRGYVRSGGWGPQGNGRIIVRWE